MHLQKLYLLNFKNYEEVNITFSAHVNCFLGNNGTGKTNLLDAIHYLSLTKSAFTNADAQSIKHGENFFLIKGLFQKEDEQAELNCSFKQGEKKVLKLNKVAYSKISEHVGVFPSVFIAPDDTLLINEGSEERRKFIDSIISQADHAYLSDLIAYNHYLKQRNALLKKFFDENTSDPELLEPYDFQLLKLSKSIYKQRKDFVKELVEIFRQQYHLISGGIEKADIEYKSDLDEDYPNSIHRTNIKKDIALQRTNFGIHRDNYVFYLNGYPIKKFGSQGQQKSFVISLKTAQFDFITRHKNFKPILLLDDIFDKLDEDRISALIELINQDFFGQVFLTDARPERTRQIFTNIKGEVNLYRVSDGKIEKF